MLNKLIFLSTATLFLATSVLADETTIHADAKQEVGATLVFMMSPLKTMTAIPFTLTLDSNVKNNIDSAACDLTMPAMPMPDNHPDLICINNTCTGKAIFTMAGKWQATFGLLMKDGEHASIVFDIAMVEMK